MQHERDMNRARESPLNPVSAGMLLGLFAIAGEQLRSMGVEAKADKATKRELTEAMERLFRAGTIHVATYGKLSKGWSRLERK